MIRPRSARNAGRRQASVALLAGVLACPAAFAAPEDAAGTAGALLAVTPVTPSATPSRPAAPVGGTGRGARSTRDLPAIESGPPQPETVPRGLIFRAPPAPARPGEVLTLEQVLTVARSENPGLNASRAASLAERAGIQTATAYPNPQVEFLAGDTRARRASAIPGRGTELSLSQPIENPALRRERRAVAEANAAGAEASVAVAEVNLRAEVRARWFDVLRAQEELQAARDDLALTEQILERIRVRARVGESPRFDLVRAETEVAVARRNEATAQARVAQNKSLLRQVVSPTLPVDFNLSGEVERPYDAEGIATLRQAVIERNPLLRISAAQLSRAERQLQVEQASILPFVGVRLLRTTEPDIQSWLGGVYVNVPIFDRRQGQIRAAQENISRARFDAEQRSFEAAAAFDAALQAYDASLAQVRALEGGIIEGARNSLEIAEAAYRFGERGILEFLDAQRTFRLVRNELIAARYNLQGARIELERLAGLGFER